ncbi:MAG: MucR family transcriptional regulator [Magnetococcales bacterium]|nr:MucR family transcriptional regulator [Magnetococcales bacterium]
MSLELLQHTQEIVSAFLSNQAIPRQDVPDLIRQVYAVLAELSGPGVAAPAAEPDASEAEAETVAPEPRRTRTRRAATPQPAVPVDEAVTEEAVTCMICGKPCQALRGHLKRSHTMEVDAYRKMFNLDKDFPMVARGYSARRRALAINAGLGDKLRQSRKVAAAGRGRRKAAPAAE